MKSTLCRLATLLILFVCSWQLTAQVMPGKTYYIRLEHSPSYFFMLSAGSNGAKSGYANNRNSTNTKWQFIHLGDHIYQIKNLSTGLYLGNAKATREASLNGYLNPGDGAKWEIVPDKSVSDDREWFHIKNVHSGLWLSKNDNWEGMQKSEGQAGSFAFELDPPTFFTGMDGNQFKYKIEQGDTKLEWKATTDLYFNSGTDGCSGPALADDFSYRLFYSCRDHDVCYSAPWQAAGLDGYKLCNEVQFTQNQNYCKEMYKNEPTKRDYCIVNARAMRDALGTKWAWEAYQSGQNYANNEVNRGKMTVLSPGAQANQDYIITLENNAPLTARIQVRYTAYDGRTITTYWSNGALAGQYAQVAVPYGARDLTLVVEKMQPLPKKTIEKSISAESQHRVLTCCKLDIANLK